jgi:hypothetical protein
MAAPSGSVGRIIEQLGEVLLRNGHGSGIIRFACNRLRLTEMQIEKRHARVVYGVVPVGAILTEGSSCGATSMIRFPLLPLFRDNDVDQRVKPTIELTKSVANSELELRKQKTKRPRQVRVQP